MVGNSAIIFILGALTTLIIKGKILINVFFKKI
jgi:hypothetical protein